MIRSEEGARRVLNYADEHEKEASRDIFLKNRLLLGRMIASAILERKESRGTHYREDYPGICGDYNGVRVVLFNDQGQIKLNREKMNID